MTDDELQIPPIVPVAAGVRRPRWSVMIPAYNSARTIAETLRSVLAQAQAPREMQIAVVDNVSTDETLAIAKNTIAAHGLTRRVEIHQNPSNLGMVGNFNSCLRLARGEVIHLLHADDFIQPGFYAAIEARMRQHPEAEIFAARVITIDPHGELECVTNRLARQGALTVFDAAYENHLYPPGVVVRRSGYERVGGYSNVISYLPDWEMWTRLLEHLPGVFINQLLACYRQNPGNATDYFSRTARDLTDMMRFGDVLARRVPNFSHDHWRGCIKRHAEWGMNKWRAAGDESAFQANQKIWRQLSSSRNSLSLKKVADLLKLTKGLNSKRARNALAATAERFDKGLGVVKELGRKFERSIRTTVRRRRKPAVRDAGVKAEKRAAG